jgi:hypothetical protein
MLHSQPLSSFLQGTAIMAISEVSYNRQNQVQPAHVGLHAFAVDKVAQAYVSAVCRCLCSVHAGS